MRGFRGDSQDWMRMPHRRSRSSQERREARRRVLREAFWDRERMEAVSLTSYPEVAVSQGEVLYTGRGFISPSIALDPYIEAYCWLQAMGLSARPSLKGQRRTIQASSGGFGEPVSASEPARRASLEDEPVGRP